MEHGEELRIYMKAANRDQSNQNDPHLSEARMIAYYRGELSEAEREGTQAHLVACVKCIALFRSLGDFLEPASADEEEITAAETNEQWQSFSQRVKVSPVVQGDFKRSRAFPSSRLTLALAASLLISLGAVGWLAWSVWQERRQSQQMAAQLENKQRELEQRLAQLTQTGADEIEREREQRLAAEAERDKLQDLLAAARPTGDDARIYPFTLSSDRGAAEELQLKLSSPAEVHLLISKPGAFGEYEVAILDEGGTMVRKFPGLRPRGIDQALRFRLNRGALTPGKYRLRLSGQQGSTSTQLGEYSVVVTGPG